MTLTALKPIPGLLCLTKTYEWDGTLRRGHISELDGAESTAGNTKRSKRGKDGAADAMANPVPPVPAKSTADVIGAAAAIAAAKAGKPIKARVAGVSSNAEAPKHLLK